MAEASLEGFSDRAGLRRALAHRLSEVQPDLRILAEGFLAELTLIDLLAVGKEGELVSIRFSKPDDDRATLTRALGDLTWLRARRADFLKLSPGLGIDPSAEPRALVVCHGFSAESLAAVDNFPENTIALWCCRGLRIETHQLLVMEPMSAKLLKNPWTEVSSATGAKSSTAREATLHAGMKAGMKAGMTAGTTAGVPSDGAGRGPAGAPPRALEPPAGPHRAPLRRPLADPPSPSAFRSGLVEADLEPHGSRESERYHTLDAEVD